MTNIKPQNPVALGLCAAPELEKVVALARAKAGIVPEAMDKPDKANSDDPIRIPKPGETLLLKGEAKADRERALEAEEVPVFAVTEENSDDGATPEVLKVAEDVFSTPPTTPKEEDTPAPSPEDNAGS